MATYVELQVTSHFSFLRGSSAPEELFAAAQLLGGDATAAPPAAAGSALTLNRGNAACGASRRRKPRCRG